MAMKKITRNTFITIISRRELTNVLHFSHDDVAEEVLDPPPNLKDPHQRLGNLILMEREGMKEGVREGGREVEGGSNA